MSEVLARDDVLMTVVRQAWSETLPTVAFDPEQSWAETGADSLLTLHLMLKLEKALGRKLSFDVMTPETTPAELARMLAEPAPPRRSETPCVFLLPGMFGDEPTLSGFRRAFGDSLAFDLIDLPDLMDPNALLRNVAATGAFAAAQIAARQSHGAILLAGYSFGGCVAYEAAQRLRATGRQVALLVLLDPYLFSGAEAAQALGRAARAPRVRPPESARERVQFAFATSRLGRAVLIAAVRRLQPRSQIMVRRRLLRRLRTQAMLRWRPLALPVTTLMAISEEFAPVTLKRWERLAPNISVVHLPGIHNRLFNPAAMDMLKPKVLDAVHTALHPPQA